MKSEKTWSLKPPKKLTFCTPKSHEGLLEIKEVKISGGEGAVR